MAKVLRTHNVGAHNVTPYVAEEITLLTRGVTCTECVEIIFERSLYRRLMESVSAFGNTVDLNQPDGKPSTILGFKYRVVHGLGVRPGSMAVITRAEIVFK